MMASAPNWIRHAGVKKAYTFALLKLSYKPCGKTGACGNGSDNRFECYIPRDAFIIWRPAAFQMKRSSTPYEYSF